MKKNFLIISLTIFCIACNSNNDQKETTKEDKPASSSNPEYDKGLALVAKSGCLTCHKPSETLVGPAYIDIAKKYENTDANINLLTDKIQKGGAGVWGTVPMAAHPSISKEDATAMVKYILLLKN